MSTPTSPERAMRLIGLAGWSGSGKTTLLTKLIPILTASGIKASTIKHAHHAFDIDHPGKDSWAHRQAGASEVLVASSNRFALIHELRGATEPRLFELLVKLSPVDLVLVEGFKHESHPKIEVFRPELGRPKLFPDDRTILAIASPQPLGTLNIPWLPLDEPSVIAEFLSESVFPGLVGP